MLRLSYNMGRLYVLSYGADQTRKPGPSNLFVYCTFGRLRYCSSAYLS